MTRAKWLGLVAVLWVAIIGGFIAYKQYTITTGTEVLLKMMPVDPRDVFRGDYMIIRYEIGDLMRVHPVVPGNPQPKEGDEIFTSFTVAQDGTASGFTASTQRPGPAAGRVYLRGVVDDRNLIRYGIESYFIPENTGSDLSRRIMQDRDKTFVRVSVDKEGRGIVRGFVVNGERIELKDLKTRSY